MSEYTAPNNASATPLHGSDLARHILSETLKTQRERREAHAQALEIQREIDLREIERHKEAVRQALDAEQLVIGETQ